MSSIQHPLLFILLLDIDDIDLCLIHSYLNDSRHGMPIVHADPGIIDRIKVPVTDCSLSGMNHITVNSCNVFRVVNSTQFRWEHLRPTYFFGFSIKTPCFWLTTNRKVVKLI